MTDRGIDCSAGQHRAFSEMQDAELRQICVDALNGIHGARLGWQGANQELWRRSQGSVADSGGDARMADAAPDLYAALKATSDFIHAYFGPAIPDAGVEAWDTEDAYTVVVAADRALAKARA